MKHDESRNNYNENVAAMRTKAGNMFFFARLDTVTLIGRIYKQLKSIYTERLCCIKCVQHTCTRYCNSCTIRLICVRGGDDEIMD